MKIRGAAAGNGWELVAPAPTRRHMEHAGCAAPVFGRELVKKEETVFIGTLNSSAIHPLASLRAPSVLHSGGVRHAGLFKSAIKEGANAIIRQSHNPARLPPIKPVRRFVIVAHNHPSGDPTPSEEDKGMAAGAGGGNCGWFLEYGT